MRANPYYMDLGLLYTGGMIQHDLYAWRNVIETAMGQDISPQFMLRLMQKLDGSVEEFFDDRDDLEIDISAMDEDLQNAAVEILDLKSLLKENGIPLPDKKTGR